MFRWYIYLSRYESYLVSDDTSMGVIMQLFDPKLSKDEPISILGLEGLFITVILI